MLDAAHRPAALVLSLGLGLSSLAGLPASAHAQDGEPVDKGTESGAEPAPGHPDGVETSESWEAFSRAFAQHLVRSRRIEDAMEEYYAVAALRHDDLDVVADAAVLLLDHATGLAQGLAPGSPYVNSVENLMRMGVQRGGRGDGRLAYVGGRLHLLNGKYDWAYELFGDARKAGFDEQRLRPWFFVAVVNRVPDMLREGGANEAIQELEALLADQPAHPNAVDAWVNLAAAYRRHNDRVKSEEILERLVASHPQDYRPWLALGREHFDQGRLEEALQAYRKALALSSAAPDAYSQSLASIALVLYKLGRLDESERAARSFMELDSGSSAALHLLAMLHRERGETLQALRLLRRADRIARDDPAILTLMEQIHYERGEVQEAKAVQKRRDAKYHEPGKESERDAEPKEDDQPGADDEPGPER